MAVSNGFIEVSYNLGKQSADDLHVLRSQTKVNDGLWHTVIFNRSGFHSLRLPDWKYFIVIEVTAIYEKDSRPIYIPAYNSVADPGHGTKNVADPGHGTKNVADPGHTNQGCPLHGPIYIPAYNSKIVYQPQLIVIRLNINVGFNDDVIDQLQ